MWNVAQHACKMDKGKMEKDKRTGWLKDLKVGDEVFLIGLYSQKIVVVEKITPTGRINAGGYQFNHYGRCRITDYRTLQLTELTPELRSKHLLSVKRERLETKVKNKINDINISKLSDEKLERLSTFLEEITG